MRCLLHGEGKSEDCVACRQPTCTRCLTAAYDGFVCLGCLHRRRRQALRRKLGAALVVGAVASVAAALFVPSLRRPLGEAGRVDPAVAEDPDVLIFRAALERDPCDRGAIVKLGEELLREQRAAEVVTEAREFLARCGDYPYLKWTLMVAHDRLGQHVEAVAIGRDIIDTNARDDDYWRWRGESYNQIPQPIPAAADFRQSLINSQDTRGAVLALSRFLDVAADRDCESLTALWYFVDHFAHRIPGELADRARVLEAKVRLGECRDRAGGSARFTLHPVTRSAQASGEVNGVKGRFLVEPNAGTTMLSPAFAARAGVTPGALTAETLVAGQIRSGKSATAARVEVGGARTADVDVLVGDLPEGFDGAIGLSFLWHFEVRDEDDRLTIRAR